MNGNDIWPLHRAIEQNRDAVAEMLIGSRILDLDAFSEHYQVFHFTIITSLFELFHFCFLYIHIVKSIYIFK